MPAQQKYCYSWHWDKFLQFFENVRSVKCDSPQSVPSLSSNNFLLFLVFALYVSLGQKSMSQFPAWCFCAFVFVLFCFCFYIFHKKLDICCIIKVTINFHNYIIKRKKISCCNITHDEPDNQIWDSSMFHSNILAAEIHFSYLESEKKIKQKTYIRIPRKKKKRKENMEKRKNSIALRVWGSRKLRHTFFRPYVPFPLVLDCCWIIQFFHQYVMYICYFIHKKLYQYGGLLFLYSYI